MPRRLRSVSLIVLLGSLAGCSGFGTYAWNTTDPFKTPHSPKSDAPNMALVHGKNPPPANLQPESGQPWPQSYPVDPTIIDIEKSGSGVP